MITKFPDPNDADENGILAVGGDLHPESLLLAYRQGIFPWPDPSFAEVIWASPPQRGVLDFKDLRVPKSLRKALKNHTYTVTIDKAFNEVLALCSALPRPDQDGTWITRDMIRAYAKFHKMGYAHSVEVWDKKNLVGGLYGVAIDGVYAGESMFYVEPNTSKIALFYLIDHLKTRGAEWIDIQMLTPHMEQIGAKLIPRSEFLDRLKQTHAQNLKLF